MPLPIANISLKIMTDSSPHKISSQYKISWKAGDIEVIRRKKKKKNIESSFINDIFGSIDTHAKIWTLLNLTSPRRNLFKIWYAKHITNQKTPTPIPPTPSLSQGQKD